MPKGPKRKRKPLWRRFNRHHLFALHVVLFLIGASIIWSLPASQPDQEFDSLAWFALLCAHGVLLYRRRRVAFALHLLMFSAGSAAIWNVFADTSTRLILNIVWAVIAAGVGLWLYGPMLRRNVFAPGTTEPYHEQAVDEDDYQEPVYYEPVDDPGYADDYGDQSAGGWPDEPPPDEAPPTPSGKRKQTRG